MTVKKVTFTKHGRQDESRKFYGIFRDHQGQRWKMPLFKDQKNSDDAARTIEHLVAIRASNSMVPLDLRRFIEYTTPRIRDNLVRWGIVDSSLVSSSEPLDTFVDEWAKALRDGEVDEGYVDLKSGRVRQLFRDCKMFRWNDIKPEAIRDRLKKYRDAEINPIGATTSNHYLQAVKQFCTWVVEEKKSASYSPLTGPEAN